MTNLANGSWRFSLELLDLDGFGFLQNTDLDGVESLCVPCVPRGVAEHISKRRFRTSHPNHPYAAKAQSVRRNLNHDGDSSPTFGFVVEVRHIAPAKIRKFIHPRSQRRRASSSEAGSERPVGRNNRFFPQAKASGRDAKRFKIWIKLEETTWNNYLQKKWQLL